MTQIALPREGWTFLQKLVFRFCFLFFGLFAFLESNGQIPFDTVESLFIGPLHRFIQWLGSHVLAISYPIDVEPNGSNDTSYHYLVLLLIMVLSIAGSLLWTVLDRRRKEYDRLYYWLMVIVRYYVAFTMLSYGFFKVFKTQFDSPGTWKLLERYGDSSPAGLAWTFFGYSWGYNIFMGFAELLGGVLLFFRRTTPAGALVTLLVTAHVMVLNYCFDIPVKITSTMLVLMSLFLLSGNLARLWDFFIGAKNTSLSILEHSLPTKKWMTWSLAIGKFLLIAFVVCYGLNESYREMKAMRTELPPMPLAGDYNVETMIQGKDTLLPLKKGNYHWKQLVINGYQPVIIIKKTDDSVNYYRFLADTAARAVDFVSFLDSTKKYRFNYELAAGGRMILRGNMRGDSIQMQIRKYSPDMFLLTTRGFHWVNEMPLLQ